jgi:hypothetical protein
MKLLLIILFLPGLCFTIAAQDDHSKDTVPDKIFEKVDIEAGFPGGMDGWRKYLDKNLNLKVPQKNGAPVGCYPVAVQFVVDKNGNITEVKPLTDFGYGMEDEVVKIIRNGPKWIPATQNGKPVKAYRKQTVTFLMIDDAFDITMKEPFFLYTNTDNRVNIEVKKVKHENLEMAMSQGKIVFNPDGSYSIFVNKPGKAILEITNRKKLGKKIGAVYFIVKARPDNPSVP